MTPRSYSWTILTAELSMTKKEGRHDEEQDEIATEKLIEHVSLLPDSGRRAIHRHAARAPAACAFHWEMFMTKRSWVRDHGARAAPREPLSVLLAD